MTSSRNVPNRQVWFLTGASSGFGEALCQLALERGDYVAATAREPDKLADWSRIHPDTFTALPLDVRDREQADQAVADAKARFGRIDIAVNNAGYALVGAVEEASDADLRDQLEVNLHGVINVTRAVLPIMREQRAGHIVQMSSLNGVQGLAGGGYYAASKFAVEGLSESLAQEVAPLGIRVTIVEPGPHRTGFAARQAMKWSDPIDDYEPTAGATREALPGMDGNQPGDPVRAAEAIARAIDVETPPLRFPLGRAAVEAIRTTLTERLDELDAWQEVSVSSDFPD